ERRFSDARFADHRDELRSVLQTGVEHANEPVQLLFTPDELLEVDLGFLRRLFTLVGGDDRVAAAALRFVQRAVGGLEQPVELVMVRPRARDADRERYGDRPRPL